MSILIYCKVSTTVSNPIREYLQIEALKEALNECSVSNPIREYLQMRHIEHLELVVRVVSNPIREYLQIFDEKEFDRAYDLFQTL